MARGVKDMKNSVDHFLGAQYGDYFLAKKRELVNDKKLLKGICVKCKTERLITADNVLRGHCSKCPECEHGIKLGSKHGDFIVAGKEISAITKYKTFLVNCVTCGYQKKIQQTPLKNGEYTQCAKCNTEYKSQIKQARSTKKAGRPQSTVEEESWHQQLIAMNAEIQERKRMRRM